METTAVMGETPGAGEMEVEVMGEEDNGKNMGTDRLEVEKGKI
jgi:hypothetical protein